MKKLEIIALTKEGEAILDNVAKVIRFKTKTFSAKMKKDIELVETE